MLTAKQIKAIRKRVRLTQQQMAGALGVSLPQVSLWENGHAKPSPLALKALLALATEALRGSK
jgi:putative transcriptional regulator